MSDDNQFIALMLVLVLLIIYGCTCAKAEPVDALRLCPPALKACLDVTTADQKEIDALKNGVKELEGRLAAPAGGLPIPLVTAIAGATGGATAGTIYKGLSGTGAGAAVGGVVGLLTGLLLK